MSTGDDDRGELTEDWFEDVEGEPGGFRDPDAETWLEEPAPPSPPRDRRQLIAALAAVVALIVIGVGVARVLTGDDDETAATTAGTAQTQPTTTAETQTATNPETTLPEDITLSGGDKGPNVRRLQRALVSLGYDVGEPDGAFGAATEEAVKQFQADSGLEADGIAGPTTIAAINDAVASQA